MPEKTEIEIEGELPIPDEAIPDSIEDMVPDRIPFKLVIKGAKKVIITLIGIGFILGLGVGYWLW